MHPFLSSVRRYGLYLLAWVPVTGIVAYLLAVPDKLGVKDALVLAIPLCLIYQFVCLSAWYPLRIMHTQMRLAAAPRLILTPIIAGTVLALLWQQVAKLLAYSLSQSPLFAGLGDRFSAQPPTLFGVGFMLYLISFIVYLLIHTVEAERKVKAQELEARIMARDAELKALKAQVNPHFLFNSLNSISALTTIDPAKAREMCILLAEFLRMTLGLGEKSSVPLSEEISLLHRYLAIEKVRFGERLQLEEDIDEESKSIHVPPLLLQPLIENAVTHGIANLPEGGKVRFVAHGQNGRLAIAIENSFDSESTPTRRGGLGLKNVRERLNARYGKEASMRAGSEDGRFRVDLSLPVETEEVRS